MVVEVGMVEVVGVIVRLDVETQRIGLYEVGHHFANANNPCISSE